MFHHFIKKKGRLAAIERNIQRINQPVYINDLYVFNDDSHVEAEDLIFQAKPPKEGTPNTYICAEDSNHHLAIYCCDEEGNVKKLLLRTTQLNDLFPINKRFADLSRPYKDEINRRFRLSFSSLTRRGESLINKNIYTDKPATERLLDHINMLANIANDTHIKNNCIIEDGKIKTKEDRLNNITRLLMNEFSLYSSEPLTINQFNALLKKMESMAEKYQPNVHLLISSLAVVTDDKRLLNVSLYIQCGPLPKIESICKAIASQMDVKYRNTNLHRRYAWHPKQVKTPAHIIARPNVPKTATVKNPLFVSNNSVFTVTTEGGAKYTQGIDICLDHTLAHSKNLVSYLIKNEESLLSKQADHILTSDSMRVINDSMFTDSVEHIDPRNRNAFNSDPSTTITNESVSVDASKYPDTQTHLENGVLYIEHPPFGSNIKVLAPSSRQVSLLKKELQDVVEENNYHYIHNKFEVSQESVEAYPQYKETAKILKHHFYPIRADAVDAVINPLFAVLLKKASKVSVFDYIVNSANYKLKNQIQHIVNEAIFAYKSISRQNDPAVVLQASEIILKGLSLNLSQVKFGLDDPFINTLLAKIEIAQDQIEKIASDRIQIHRIPVKGR